MSAAAKAAGFAGQAASLAWPEPGLAWVTFTRGDAMNTITFEFLADLARALDEAEAAGARALVLTGEGRAFCGGAELTYFTDPATPLHSARDIRQIYVDPIARLFTRLEALPIPSIAAIGGYAFGGGCELALACDLRVMADTASIGLTELHLGAVPGAGGIARLQRLLGAGRATELLLLGRRLSAADALRIGLVTESAPLDELADRAHAMVATLRRASPDAIAETKHCLRVCEGVDMATADELCLDAVERLASGERWREGMTAFIEKRRPRF